MPSRQLDVCIELLLVSLEPRHDNPDFCEVLSMRNKNNGFFGLGKFPKPWRRDT